uniref:Uncharacterized protein n=1 Tax=Bartheletia paradoxa TaxID=669517 RepID=A0A2D0XHS9_9BASI|nr:hypothetical protein SPAR04510 [Bartheletia paradoxa]
MPPLNSRPPTRHHASASTSSLSSAPGPPSSSGEQSESAAPTTSSAKREDDDNEDVGKLDLGLLRDLARRGLTDLLDEVPGAKTLVIDPSLAGPLGLVTDVSLLKNHGIDKMFYLESGPPLVCSTKHIVYLCRPTVAWMRVIADQINAHVAQTPAPSHTYTLLLTPRRTSLCDRLLSDLGVLGHLAIREYRLEFIPLEDDVLSLESDGVYKEVNLDGDETAVFASARAIMTLQRAYGLIPRIVGKGDAAKRLSTMLLRLRAESLLTDPTSPALRTPSHSIDTMIVIERASDMVTPMCTQLTYEGLVDEVFGLKNSHAEVPASLLSPAPTAPPSAATASTTAPAAEKKKKHLFSAANDPLFKDIRDANFGAVAGLLHKRALRVSEDYEGRHKAKTVAQIREFVGKLGGLQNEHQSLRLHTGLSELITPVTRSDEFNRALEIQQNLIASVDTTIQQSGIEELINQQAPLPLVLRLLVLASLTSGGIKPKNLDNFKREILQAYGYEQLPMLVALSSLNLLVKATPARAPYSTLRKSFRLIVDDVDEHDPNDISYVYSGYAPLSIRLVQAVAQKSAILAPPTTVLPSIDARKDEEKPRKKKPRAHAIVGWKGFEEPLKLIPGEAFDDVQTVEEGLDKRAFVSFDNS